MAGSALLEREIEKITGETEVSDEAKERERLESEEAYAHRQRMAENLRDIIERRVDFADSRNESDYEPQNIYQYSGYDEAEHSPVVPTAQIAPNASERINDYLAANRSIEEMRSRSGEAYRTPQEGVFERALARVLASEYAAAPVDEYEEYEPTEEQELYEQGIFMSADVRTRERAQMPEYSPSYMPVEEPPTFTTEESDDALPTHKTLETIREKPVENKHEESEERVPMGLSAKTKVILAALAATIAILIAIISINTAVLNSVRASIREREGTLTELSDTLSGIETEITDLTSFENVENWANSHGMTPPNP